MTTNDLLPGYTSQQVRVLIDFIRREKRVSDGIEEEKETLRQREACMLARHREGGTNE